MKTCPHYKCACYEGDKLYLHSVLLYPFVSTIGNKPSVMLYKSINSVRGGRNILFKRRLSERCLVPRAPVTSLLLAKFKKNGLVNSMLNRPVSGAFLGVNYAPDPKKLIKT